MSNKTIFSNKGFYFGVVIFSLGIILMVARVMLDLQTLEEEKPVEKVQEKNKIEQRISENIVSLQNQLDKKIEQPISNRDYKINQKTKHIEIFDHNPILNKSGNILVVEFVDLNCKECLEDAQRVNKSLTKDSFVKLVTKLNNVDNDKQLNVVNLAALCAAKEGKFFEFRNKVLQSDKINLDSIINILNETGVSLQTFRKSLSDRPDVFLNRLSQDIRQAQSFNVDSYTVIIEGVVFSDSVHSANKLDEVKGFIKALKLKK